MTKLKEPRQEKEKAWKAFQKVIKQYNNGNPTDAYLEAEERFRIAYYNLLMEERIQDAKTGL